MHLWNHVHRVRRHQIALSSQACCVWKKTVKSVLLRFRMLAGQRRESMAKKTSLPAEVTQALGPSIAFLQRMARYKLESAFDRRMLELGENKEFLSKEEHDELMALVAFSERRNIERLEALVALKRLAEVVPGVEIPFDVPS